MNIKKVGIVLLHILCWLVFLLLPGLFRPDIPDHSLPTLFADLLTPPRITNALLLIAVFYFNFLLAVPKFWFRGLFVSFFFSLAVCFTLLVVINVYPKFWIAIPGINSHGSGLAVAEIALQRDGALGPAHNFFMFLIVYVVSFSARVYKQLQHTRTEKLNAEISFLKAQINPHFLFNTLNNIYSLTLTKSDNAAEAVLQLSSMMRYAVSEANQESVSLSKELDYISNYVKLQRLRLPAKASVHYGVDGDINGYHIAPLILMAFVENAFKYGVNAEKNSSIEISILIDRAELIMRVHNRKVMTGAVREDSTGIGLENTKLRLELLYPGKHKLVLKDNEEDFTIHLQLELT